jgi:hypothetical protein
VISAPYRVGSQLSCGVDLLADLHPSGPANFLTSVDRLESACIQAEVLD